MGNGFSKIRHELGGKLDHLGSSVTGSFAKNQSLGATVALYGFAVGPNGILISQGSAVLVTLRNILYFVTCWHVVWNAK
jgi:hypothetical protein